MLMISASWWIVGAGAAAVVALVAWRTLRAERDRSAAWHQFANRHGLECSRGPRGPLVRGRLHGREVELSYGQESSDAGLLGIEEDRLTVRLDGVPEGLELSPGGDLLGRVSEALDRATIETGDEDFDAAVVVHADDAEAARAWLTPDRRASVRELLDAKDWELVGLAGSRLYLEQREIRCSPEELDARLALLLLTADRLDPS